MFTHLEAMMLFALLVSVALAFLTKRTAGERARYTLRSLAWFVVASLAIAWLMYPFSR
jgi:hypothetical protein